MGPALAVLYVPYSLDRFMVYGVGFRVCGSEPRPGQSSVRHAASERTGNNLFQGPLPEKPRPQSGRDCLMCAEFAGVAPRLRHAAAEQGGDNLKGFDDFYLKAKAIIWPWLPYVCRIRWGRTSTGSE